MHERLSDLDGQASAAGSTHGSEAGEQMQLVQKQDEHLTAGKEAFRDVVELYKRMLRAIIPLLLCNLLYYAAWSYCVPSLFCRPAIKNARVCNVRGRLVQIDSSVSSSKPRADLDHHHRAFAGHKCQLH